MTILDSNLSNKTSYQKAPPLRDNKPDAAALSRLAIHSQGDSPRIEWSTVLFWCYLLTIRK